jgi:hypothetical protein
MILNKQKTRIKEEQESNNACQLANVGMGGKQV